MSDADDDLYASYPDRTSVDNEKASEAFDACENKEEDVEGYGMYGANSSFFVAEQNPLRSDSEEDQQADLDRILSVVDGNNDALSENSDKQDDAGSGTKRILSSDSLKRSGSGNEYRSLSRHGSSNSNSSTKDEISGFNPLFRKAATAKGNSNEKAERVDDEGDDTERLIGGSNEQDSDDDSLDSEKPAKDISFLESTHAMLLSSPHNLFLLAIIPSLACYYGNAPAYITFIFSVLALGALAERLSYATEQICIHTNDTVAGLLNVTFGNATELIVGIVALTKHMQRLLQLSLIGSVLSNSLLVLGSAFVFGGLRYKTLHFNAHFGPINAVLLVLVAASILLPTSSYESDQATYLQELGVSRATSLGLVLVYGCSILFQLYSHSRYFNLSEASGSVKWSASKQKTSKANSRDSQSSEDVVSVDGATRSLKLANHQKVTEDLEEKPIKDADKEDEDEQQQEEEDDENEEDELGFVNGVIWLAIITALIALCSDALVDTIENAADGIGVSSNFLATIILPIVGNAAEHSSAIVFGYKGRPTLAVAIAIGSSLQIALFVLPLLILLAWMMQYDIDLDMGSFESFSVLVAVLLAVWMLHPGRATWLSGSVLLMAYVLIAAGFCVRKEQSLSL